jgi:hypothetical protein
VPANPVAANLVPVMQTAAAARLLPMMPRTAKPQRVVGPVPRIRTVKTDTVRSPAGWRTGFRDKVGRGPHVQLRKRKRNEEQSHMRGERR